MALIIQTEPAEEPLSIEEVKTHLRVDMDDDDDLIQNLITSARQYAESYLKRSLISQTWKYYLDEWPESGEDYIELPMPPLQSVSSVKYTDYNSVQTTLGTAVVQATGTITVTGTPLVDEHLVVDTRTFHFKVLASTVGEITIDADNTLQAHNIVTALTAGLNSVTSAHTLGVVTVTAVAVGSLGNSVVLTTNATGVTVNGSGTLSNGADSDYVIDKNKEPGRIVLAYGETWPSATLTVTSPIEIIFICGYGTPEDIPRAIRSAMLIYIGTLYEQRESIIVGQTFSHLKTIEALLEPYRIYSF